VGAAFFQKTYPLERPGPLIAASSGEIAIEFGDIYNDGKDKK